MGSQVLGALLARMSMTFVTFQVVQLNLWWTIILLKVPVDLTDFSAGMIEGYNTSPLLFNIILVLVNVSLVDMFVMVMQTVKMVLMSHPLPNVRTMKMIS